VQIEYEEMIMYFSMAGMGGKKISAREQAAEEVMSLSVTLSRASVLLLAGFVRIHAAPETPRARFAAASPTISHRP
jgi:hypothetical protein